MREDREKVLEVARKTGALLFGDFTLTSREEEQLLL